MKKSKTKDRGFLTGTGLSVMKGNGKVNKSTGKTQKRKNRR